MSPAGPIAMEYLSSVTAMRQIGVRLYGLETSTSSLSCCGCPEAAKITCAGVLLMDVPKAAATEAPRCNGLARTSRSGSEQVVLEHCSVIVWAVERHRSATAEGAKSDRIHPASVAAAHATTETVASMSAAAASTE
jgi:hypothetical protein